MDNTQNLGQPVGKVTTTYNGEKIQVNVYADRSVTFRMASGAQGQAGSGRCPHR